jgi:hypothetical protein
MRQKEQNGYYTIKLIKGRGGKWERVAGGDRYTFESDKKGQGYLLLLYTTIEDRTLKLLASFKKNKAVRYISANSRPKSKRL